MPYQFPATLPSGAQHKRAQKKWTRCSYTVMHATESSSRSWGGRWGSRERSRKQNDQLWSSDRTRFPNNSRRDMTRSLHLWLGFLICQILMSHTVVLNALRGFLHLILTSNLWWGRCYSQSHFVDEDTEADKSTDLPPVRSRIKIWTQDCEIQSISNSSHFTHLSS